MRKVETHQPIMGPHYCLVDLQIGWASAQTLHIDAPFFWIQPERFECSTLASQLDGINVLVASVESLFSIIGPSEQWSLISF